MGFLSRKSKAAEPVAAADNVSKNEGFVSHSVKL